MVDECEVGQSRRVVHLFRVSLLVIHHVRHVGHGGDDVHVELAVETLLHDFHVQQTQESASESESQCYRRLWLERERRVVELQFLKRRAQILIFARLYGVDSSKHHWFHLLESGDGFLARTCNMCYGIANLYLGGVFYSADDISHLASLEVLTWNHVHLQHAHLVGVILHACVEEFHLVAFVYAAVFNLEVVNDATKRVEHGVEDESL